MKILASAVDQSLSAEAWGDICTWAADGTTKILGFIAFGQVSARFRIRNTTDGVTLGEYLTTPGNMTAYVVCKEGNPETAADSIKVQVYHEAPEAKNFSAYILAAT